MKVKLTTKQKLFHFLCVPMLAYLTIYLFLYLIGYAFNKPMPAIFAIDDKAILFVLLMTIIFSIDHWITLYFPREKQQVPKRPRKSLREYVSQYVIHGSFFHRFIVAVYLFCIIIGIVVISLTITGRL